MKASLRTWLMSPARAVGLLGVVAVLVVIIASEAYLMRQRAHDLEHAIEEASSVSRMVAEQKARAFQSVDLILEGIAERITDFNQMKLANSDYVVHLMMNSRIAAMPHIGAVFVVDDHGVVVNASAEHPIRQINVADREYYLFHRQHPDAGVFIGPPLINRMGGEWTVHMSRPINSASGKLVGVVVAALNLAYVENLNDLRLNYISPISLYLNDGRLLTRSPRDENLLGQPFPLPARQASTDSLRIEKTLLGDEAATTLYREISGFPLTLAVTTKEFAALEGWRHNAVAVRSGAAAVSLFIILITFLLVREVRREQALSASLTQTGRTLQALVDTALDAIISVDAEQNVVLFNPAAAAMFGCTASQASGLPLSRFLRSDDSAETMTHRGSWQAVGLRADGSEFPVEASVSQLEIGGQVATTVVLRDISDRLRAETALQEGNAELSRLSKSLIAVRESERTRIARELHDELGQQLMRLRLDLSWLAGRLRETQPGLETKVGEMKNLLAETVGSVRRITTELRPPLLDDLGTVAAVEWLLDDFAQRSRLEIDAAIDPVADRCDIETATALYRILQEALTNVGRHAQATAVRVALRESNGRLVLDIEDNGRGLSRAGTHTLRSGNGLVGIRERVLMLGGTLEIDNAISGGLSLIIDLPLPKAPT